MSDPRTDDPTASGLDKGTGDPNDDRAFLNDLPPAQVKDESEGDETTGDFDSDEADADA